MINPSAEFDKRKLDEGLEMVRCVQANIENLKKAIPGITTVPMFKIVELQIGQAEAALMGRFDD